MNMQQRRQRKGQMVPVAKTGPVPMNTETNPDSVQNRDFVQLMMAKKDVNYSQKYAVDLFQKEESISDSTFKALFREIEDIYSVGESYRACFDREGYIHMSEYVRRKFKITRPQYETMFSVAKRIREQVNKILEAYSGALLDMFRMTDSDIGLPSKDNNKSQSKNSSLKIESPDKVVQTKKATKSNEKGSSKNKSNQVTAKQSKFLLPAKDSKKSSLKSTKKSVKKSENGKGSKSPMGVQELAKRLSKLAAKGPDGFVSSVLQADKNVRSSTSAAIPKPTSTTIKISSSKVTSRIDSETVSQASKANNTRKDVDEDDDDNQVSDQTSQNIKKGESSTAGTNISSPNNNNKNDNEQNTSDEVNNDDKPKSEFNNDDNNSSEET